MSITKQDPVPPDFRRFLSKGVSYIDATIIETPRGMTRLWHIGQLDSNV